MTEKTEEWYAYVRAQLTEPIEEHVRDDGTYLTSGRPPEVVVRIRRSTVTVFEFALRDGDEGSVVCPVRVGSVRCHRLPERAGMKAVQALIAGARESRRQKFRTCDSCGRHQPPEWMFDDGTCRACATKQTDVVH